jgi:hypothetical protein
MAAILRLEALGAPHIDEYKSDYQVAYAIPFDSARRRLGIYPGEFWGACDIHATAFELDFWQQPWILGRRDAVLNSARRIIMEVKYAPEHLLPGIFGDGGALKEDWERLLRMCFGT